MVIEQTMTNSDVLAEVYGELPTGHHGWVCHFHADPSAAPADAWSGRPYRGLPAQASVIDNAVDDNTYYCTAVLKATETGEIVRRKDAFWRLAVLVLDDVQLEEITGCSYSIQTSPGKRQVGILLDSEDQDTYDRQLVDRVMSSLAARGWMASDRSGNNAVRYVRLPVGANTKPRAAGTWQVQLELWKPTVRWSLEDACQAVGIDLDALRAAPAAPTAPSSTTHGSHAGEFVQGLFGPLGDRSYHDNLTRMAASLVSGGMFPGAAVEHLYSLMDAARPMGPEEEVRRWEARRAEIPRAVKSAEKYAPEARQPPSITVNLSGKQEQQEQAAVALPGSGVQFLYLLGFASRPPAEIDWVVDGWIAKGTVTTLYGKGGVGKSLLSLQLAAAIATAQPVFGLKTSGRRVMAMFCEDDTNEIHRRIYRMSLAAKQFTITDVAPGLDISARAGMDNVIIAADDSAATAHSTPLLDEIKAKLAELHYDLLILDNIAQMMAVPENKRSVVTQAVNILTELAIKFNVAVLLLGHPAKATDSEFSGSTAWDAAVRARLLLERDKDDDSVVYLRKAKANYSTRETLELRFSDGAYVLANDPKAQDLNDAERSRAQDVVVAALRCAHDNNVELTTSARSPSRYICKFIDAKGLDPFHLREKAVLAGVHELIDKRVIEEVTSMDRYGRPKKVLRFVE